MDLRPVTFRFAEEIAGEETGPQYSLIAEEVAEAMPQLVNYDDQGRPESVKYRFLAPMLLNELQRQQRQIRSLQILLGSSLIFALGLGLARWRSG